MSLARCADLGDDALDLAMPHRHRRRARPRSAGAPAAELGAIDRRVGAASTGDLSPRRLATIETLGARDIEDPHDRCHGHHRTATATGDVTQAPLSATRVAARTSWRSPRHERLNSRRRARTSPASASVTSARTSPAALRGLVLAAALGHDRGRLAPHVAATWLDRGTLTAAIETLGGAVARGGRARSLGGVIAAAPTDLPEPVSRLLHGGLRRNVANKARLASLIAGFGTGLRSSGPRGYMGASHRRFAAAVSRSRVFASAALPPACSAAHDRLGRRPRVVIGLVAGGVTGGSWRDAPPRVEPHPFGWQLYPRQGSVRLLAAARAQPNTVDEQRDDRTFRRRGGAAPATFGGGSEAWARVDEREEENRGAGWDTEAAPREAGQQRAHPRDAPTARTAISSPRRSDQLTAPRVEAAPGADVVTEEEDRGPQLRGRAGAETRNRVRSRSG